MRNPTPSIAAEQAPPQIDDQDFERRRRTFASGPAVGQHLHEFWPGNLAGWAGRQRIQQVDVPRHLEGRQPVVEEVVAETVVEEPAPATAPITDINALLAKLNNK